MRINTSHPFHASHSGLNTVIIFMTKYGNCNKDVTANNVIQAILTSMDLCDLSVAIGHCISNFAFYIIVSVMNVKTFILFQQQK